MLRYASDDVSTARGFAYDDGTVFACVIRDTELESAYAIRTGTHPIYAMATQPMFSLKREANTPTWMFGNDAYDFHGSDMDAEPLVR